MPELPLEPDDPCGCGNGKRYADCHMRNHQAPADQRVALAQATYAEDWAGNAEHYRQQGLYAELAAELLEAGPVRRVLDVGCGRGEGLEALLHVVPPEGRLVIGVDENPACLTAAAARFGASAGEAQLRRTTTEVLSSGAYRIRAGDSALPPATEVTLLNVDLMLKDHVFEMWLIGVHGLPRVFRR